MQEEQFANLLRMVKLTGGKYVIVEDGVPRAVLMSYEEFSELAVPAAAAKVAEKIAGLEIAESVNREITTAQIQDLRDLREEVILDDDLEIAPDQSIRIEPLDAV